MKNLTLNRLLVNVELKMLWCSALILPQLANQLVERKHSLFITVNGEIYVAWEDCRRQYHDFAKKARLSLASQFKITL